MRGRALRSPWNRGRDRVAAVLLAVVCVVAALLVWTFSDARATTLDTASPAPPLPRAPSQVPATLTQLWQAASPATPEPVAVGPTVVTAGSGDVLGRDALTGKVRWKYSRDLKLCTVASAWSKILTVYRNGTGCSDITQLAPETGERTAQRNSNAQLGTRLVTDCAYPGSSLDVPVETDDPPKLRCTHVTTTGQTLLNTWRSDLVRTVEYGSVPALIQPGKQPRPNCHYGAVAAAADRVGVIERCPGAPQDRLTVYEAAPENWDDPKVVFSVVLDHSPAKLVAMSDEAVAVSVPETRSLVLYNMDGEKTAAYPLEAPRRALAGKAAGGVVPTARGTDGVYWFTGSSTVALAPDTLEPRWTLPAGIGAGTMFAGQYVVPVRGGLAVLNQQTGETIRTVAVDRGAYSGRVVLDATGPALVEKRGDTVVALR